MFAISFEKIMREDEVVTFGQLKAELQPTITASEDAYSRAGEEDAIKRDKVPSTKAGR